MSNRYFKQKLKQFDTKEKNLTEPLENIQF